MSLFKELQENQVNGTPIEPRNIVIDFFNKSGINLKNQAERIELINMLIGIDQFEAIELLKTKDVEFPVVWTDYKLVINGSPVKKHFKASNINEINSEIILLGKTSPLEDFLESHPVNLIRIFERKDVRYGVESNSSEIFTILKNEFSKFNMNKDQIYKLLKRGYLYFFVLSLREMEINSYESVDFKYYNRVKNFLQYNLSNYE